MELRDILNKTAEVFGVSPAFIQSKSRKIVHCIARDIFVMLSLDYGFDRHEVAETACRNRCTTYDNREVAENELLINPVVRFRYNQLKTYFDALFCVGTEA